MTMQSPNRFKDKARGVSADMSGEAVAKRIRIMDQLWKAAQKARPSGKSRHIPPKTALA